MHTNHPTGCFYFIKHYQMQLTDGSITTQGDGYSQEDILLTYSEDEKQEHEVNKTNAKTILNPKFIPAYTSMIQEGYSYLECLIYGFIDFFLSNNDKFYCTNEQLGQMLNVSEKTVSIAVKKLKDDGLIDVSYRIKAGGGKLRIVKLVKSDFTKMYSGSLQKCKGIENKVIENKIIYNTLHKCNDSGAENLQPLNSLSPVEEQTPTPLTPRPQKRQDIDLLIDTIKGVCNELGVAYNGTKDRMFAKHILDTVAFGELCDKVGQDRITFATNILKASVKINYFKGACSGPMAIYQNYADVYNKTMLKHNKQNSLVGYLPGLNITQGQN